MPRTPTSSTINRAHLSYFSEERTPGCVNIAHDHVDCYIAAMPYAEYCEPCRRYSLRNNPLVRLSDVAYVLDYGEGMTKPLCHTFGMVPVREPVYVWRCLEDLNYTAPYHVSEACWERLALSTEVAAAERAAGWDPNP